MSALGERRLHNRVALALALVALLAAVLAALGPAEPERVVVTWPDRVPAATSPEREWVTPLLLGRYVAERVTARVPCAPRPVPPRADEPLIVLATARDAGVWNALHVSWTARRGLEIDVGASRLAAVRPPAAPGGCAVTISIDGRDWEVAGADGDRLGAGRLGAAVGVTGLRTSLDVRATPELRVRVEPAPQDTSPSPAQTGLRMLAVVSVLLAAALLGVRVPRPSTGALARPSLPDGLVVGALATWWLAGPIAFDDGWVIAREVNSTASGGFSNYYEHLGVNLPLGTWIEWAQHHLVTRVDSLVWQRLPAVVLLLAAWVLCRRILLRDAAPSIRGNAAWWSAAAFFAVGAVAFGVTLRHEAFLALAMLVSLSCAMSIARRPRVAPLAGALLVAGLAVSTHPAGALVLVPPLVAAPVLLRGARRRELSATGLVAAAAAGTAWGTVLLFLDTDVDAWRDAGRVIRSSAAHNLSWSDEDVRYRLLADAYDSSPLHRYVVVALLVVVLAFVVRGLGGRAVEARLPALSVLLGLVVLMATPSKWIWHFGGFVGVGAVAAAVLASDLVGTSRSARERAARAVVVVALPLGVLWSVQRGFVVAPLELGREASLFGPGWTPAAIVTLVGGAALLALVVLRSRGRAASTSRGAALAAWMLPATASSILAVSALALVVAPARGDAWTLQGQTLGSAVGRSGCGVADAITVVVAGQPTSLASVLRDPERTALVSPFVRPYFPCARSPEVAFGIAEPPDLLIDWSRDSWPILNESSPFRGLADLYELRPVTASAPDRLLDRLELVWARVDPRDAVAPATRRLGDDDAT